MRVFRGGGGARRRLNFSCTCARCGGWVEGRVLVGRQRGVCGLCGFAGCFLGYGGVVDTWKAGRAVSGVRG